MIPVSECPEHEVKSKIGKIFVNEKNTRRIFCQDLWSWFLFLWALRKKIQVAENGHKNILFRIDAYFTEYLLAVETDEKGHTDRGLLLRTKGKKH